VSPSVDADFQLVVFGLDFGAPGLRLDLDSVVDVQCLQTFFGRDELDVAETTQHLVLPQHITRDDFGTEGQQLVNIGHG
jgi:hypothetical protein